MVAYFEISEAISLVPPNFLMHLTDSEMLRTIGFSRSSGLLSTATHNESNNTIVVDALDDLPDDSFVIRAGRPVSQEFARSALINSYARSLEHCPAT